MKQWLTLCFALFVIASPVKAGSYQQLTDNDEIRKIFLGHTLKGVELDSGATWTEYYDESGKVCFQIGDYYAGGRWLVTEGEACFQYEDNQDVLCYVVLEKDSAYYMAYTNGPNAGEIGFRVTERLEGNVEYLGLDAACSGGGT